MKHQSNPCKRCGAHYSERAGWTISVKTGTWHDAFLENPVNSDCDEVLKWIEELRMSRWLDK